MLTSSDKNLIITIQKYKFKCLTSFACNTVKEIKLIFY